MIGHFLVALAAASAPGPDCTAVNAALPQAGACVEQAGNIALAPDEATAAETLTQARAGEERFRGAFGREPVNYAVFVFDDPSTVGSTSEALRGLGFTIVLPLPSKALRERMVTDARQRAAASSTAAPSGQVRRVTVGAGTGAVGEPRGGNTVPHELGHLWYTNAFWPAAVTSTPVVTRRYGSAAPDWLDEAAAMLMEDEAGTRSYFNLFAAGRGADRQRAALIPPEVPLATLTSMPHPTLALMPEPGAESGPVVVTVMNQPTLFYPQVRVFVDYLIERSGDARILAAVSAGMAGGATFDEWLVRHGSEHDLPTSLAAMQADWDAWLDRRFGAAPVS